MSDDAAVKQAADQARAVMTDMILEDFESDAQYAAVAAAHRSELGVTPQAAPAAPVSPVASAAQPEEGVHVAATEAEAAPAEAEAPSFTFDEPEVPEDILALLNTPDFEAEAEAELETPDETNDFDDEYVSEETQSERKRRIAAEKKAAWLESRLAENNRDKWTAEALKYFPYAEHALSGIKATSRRQFLRDAQAAHTAMKPHIEGYLKRAGAVVEQTVASARAETQAQVKEAWGAPTVDSTSAVTADARFEAEIAQSRRESRSLEEHFQRLVRAADQASKK